MERSAMVAILVMAVMAPVAALLEEQQAGPRHLLSLFSTAPGASKLLLTAQDGAADSWYGGSVYVSGDGLTVAVGAWADDAGGVEDVGSVYVYDRADSTSPWLLGQKLTASDGAADSYFGSVSLSTDGLRLLVGAYAASVNGNAKQGCAYVFSRPSRSEPWTQEAKLVANDGGAQETFGYFARLSVKGDLAVISSFATDKLVTGTSKSSAFYIFARVFIPTLGTVNWVQQHKLTAVDGAAADWFGGSVALDESAKTALVGAGEEDINGNVKQGSFYIYKRPTETDPYWAQVGKKTAPDGAANDRYGVSVSMSADALTALVGAYRAKVGGNAEQGKVYVYTREDYGAIWELTSVLTASDGEANDRFGGALSLSADGKTALLGSRAFKGGVINTDGSGANATAAAARPGKAYVFTCTKRGGNWTQMDVLSAGPVNNAAGTTDEFGYSVSLSGDGSTAVVGARKATVNGNLEQGSVYIFQRAALPPPPPSPPTLPASPAMPPPSPRPSPSPSPPVKQSSPPPPPSPVVISAGSPPPVAVQTSAAAAAAAVTSQLLLLWLLGMLALVLLPSGLAATVV